jgi:WXG100 family type VII secretion target
MAGQEIKIVYEIAEAMAHTFAQSQQQVQETMQAVQSVANALEGGALLGLGGDAFVEAIRSQFTPSLTKLADKFQELEGDVKAAIQYMQEADKTSESKF